MKLNPGHLTVEFGIELQFALAKTTGINAKASRYEAIKKERKKNDPKFNEMFAPYACQIIHMPANYPEQTLIAQHFSSTICLTYCPA